MFSRAWSVLAGGFLAMCLLSLCLVKCNWQPDVRPEKTAVAWLKPGANAPIHDTVTTTKIVERVVVHKIYVPRVDTLRDTVRVEVPHYYVQTKYITVAAKTEPKGLVIDSLALPNTKSILAFHDKKGNVTLDVQNSNPYFKSADVKGFTYHIPVLSRWSYGPYVGVGLAPNGAVVPTVGFGVMLNLNRKR
jgi:hypothetical protein